MKFRYMQNNTKYCSRIHTYKMTTEMINTTQENDYLAETEDQEAKTNLGTGN